MTKYLKYIIHYVKLMRSPEYARQTSLNYWSHTKQTHGDLSEKNFKSYFDEIIKLLGDVRNKKVMDFAAGSGQLSVMLKKAGAEVVAVEFVEHFIKDIEEQGITAIYPADLSGREEYDIVLINNAFFYIHPKDHQKTLENFYRELKPGGICLIADTPDKKKRGLIAPPKQPKKTLHTLWTGFFPVYQPDKGGFYINFNRLKKQAKRAGYSKQVIMDSWAYYRSHILLTK